MTENVVKRTILWGDLDALGIVYYPRYYEWMDGCGHLFLEAVGLRMGDLWRERGILFALVETSCHYFNPGRYHQRIHIRTRIDALGSKTLVFRHIIEEMQTSMLLVEGMEKRICLDVSDQMNLRSMAIPEDILGVLQRAFKGPDRCPAGL